MKKISHILFLIVFFAQVICAQDNNNASSHAKLVKIEYQSIGELNKAVTLSASITLPANSKNVSSIILSFTSRNEFTRKLTLNGSTDTPWASATDNGAAIVETDGFVKGDSKMNTVSKFSYNLAGRQSIDALIAAISYLKQNGYIKSEYKSYIVGYGIGANMALAAERSMESNYSDEVKAEVNLKSTFYEDAQDPIEIWHKAINGEVSYSAYTTIEMLDNMLKAYSEDCMKAFTEKDVFSQKLINSGILKLINTNNFDEAKIKKLLLNVFGTKNPDLKEIISDNLAQENSAVRRAIEKAMAKNVLSTRSNAKVTTPDAFNTTVSTSITNPNIAKLVQILEQTIITGEDLFLAMVNKQIFGVESIEIPILLYYSSSILKGSLCIKGNLDVNLTLSMYSLFMEKTADITLTLSPNIISTLSGQLPGKVKINYYGRGWIGMDIDAANVIPVIQNISYLVGDGTFQNDEESKNAAEQINGAINTFSIDVNEVPCFTGSIGSAQNTDGTYNLDLLFNKDGKSISLATIKKLLF